MRIQVDPKFPADPSSLVTTLKDRWRVLCTQLNGLTEGRISAVTNAVATPPTMGVNQLADFIRNPNPAVIAGSVGSEYIVWGHVCLVPGDPGTWYELRIPISQYVPGDPYWSSVVAALHFDGANNSNTFTDEKGKTWTRNATSAVISTTQSKFGGASLRTQSSDYLQTVTSTDFDLTGDYTIDFWVRPDSLSGNFGLVHRGFYTSATNTWAGLSFSIRHLGTATRFYFYGTSFANEQRLDVNDGAGGLQAGVWKHVAMVKSGTTGYVFIDGQLGGTVGSLNTPAVSTQTVRLGVWDYSAGSEYFTGYIDDLRITKGAARWTANFVPPTTAFPNY